MQQEQLTLTEIAAFTDTRLRDELNHAAYVVARLFETKSTVEAHKKLNVFTVMRLESQKRHS